MQSRFEDIERRGDPIRGDRGRRALRIRERPLTRKCCQIPKRPRHNAAQWWADRLAPGRPVLAKEARVFGLSMSFRCHLHDATSCFASRLVAIPQAEQVQAAH